MTAESVNGRPMRRKSRVVTVSPDFRLRVAPMDSAVCFLPGRPPLQAASATCPSNPSKSLNQGLIIAFVKFKLDM